MSNTSNAEAAPAPDAGGNPQPNLTVVPASKPGRPPGVLNMAQQRELVLVMQVCTAALKPAYAAPLLTRLITAEFVNQLVADVTTALNKSLKAANCTTARKSATAGARAFKETLVRSLRSLQAAAKQAYSDTDPARLEFYYVGEKIQESRAMLEAAGQGIVNKASEERPPGVNTEVLVRVTAELQAYKQGKYSQSTEQSKASTERGQRDELVASIKKRRMKIQFAADAQWPPRLPVNAGVRGEFKLPSYRPFNG